MHPQSFMAFALPEAFVFLCCLDLREEVSLMHTRSHEVSISLALVCSWSYSCPQPCSQTNQTCTEISASSGIRNYLSMFS